MESRVVGFLGVLVLRTAGWSVGLAPAPLRVLAGRALGRLVRSLGLRSKVVRENLEIAFPGEENRGLRERLFAEAYTHIGHLILEILMVFGPMRSFALKRTEFRGIEHWKKAKAKGNGVIILSSHVGNWEVMAACGALREGIDILLVTKHLKPEWLHRAIEAGRKRCNVDATYEPRTLRDILGHLKAGRTIGIVLDQYAGPPIGVRVPFFGRPVGTTTAVATIAKRTRAIVLPVVNYRLPDGRFVVEMRGPIDWLPGSGTEEDAPRELAENTAAYAAFLEGDVRAHPEQWLWTHRRFKGDQSPLREGEWSERRARR